MTNQLSTDYNHGIWFRVDIFHTQIFLRNANSKDSKNVLYNMMQMTKCGLHQIPSIVIKTSKVLNQCAITVCQAKKNLLYFTGYCHSLFMEPKVIPPTHCSCISGFTVDPCMLPEFCGIRGKIMMCQIIRVCNLSYINGER